MFLNATWHLQPSLLSVLTEPDRFLIYKSCFCITNEAIINCDFHFLFFSVLETAFSVSAWLLLKWNLHAAILFLLQHAGAPLQVSISAFLSVCSSCRRGCRWGGGRCDEPVTLVPCWPSYNLFKYCTTVTVIAQQWFPLRSVCDSVHAGLYLWFTYTKTASYTSYSFAKLE